jgi:hypothetical protein
MICLYEEGASDVEVCKALRISYNEFDARRKSDTIFSQLVDYGRLAAKSWWIELGRKGAVGGKINYPVWYANMKNRYGWSDRSEIVQSDGDKPMDQMSQDELIGAIAQRKEKLARLLGTSNVLLSQLALDESSASN